MVGVAQLVERCVVVADVAGSSPVTHPNVKSRDIVNRCLATWFIGASFCGRRVAASFGWAGWFACGLAVAAGVECEVSEDFAGVGVDDGDVEVVDEDADTEPSPGPIHATHLRAVALTRT
jgi:hypothetical protein